MKSKKRDSMIYLQNYKIAISIFIRKPLFLLRTIKSYFLALLPGKLKPLRFVDISVTHKCNFNCFHCSEKNLERNKSKCLSIDEYKKIAKKLIKEGAVIFHFTGGEPFILPNLEEIILAFKPKWNMISLQSNASLITEERLKSLKEIGLDMLCISIDGSDPQSHDDFRKHPGSYEKCWKVVEKASGLGIQTSVSTVVNHNNIKSPELEKLILMAKKTNSNCFFNLAVPLGNYKDCEDELLTEEDRKYMEDLIKKYPHCRTDFESNYYKSGCPAIKEKCYVTPEGDIIPCPFIHIPYGNIVEEDMRQIRRNGLEKIPELVEYLPICPAAESKEFHYKYYKKGLDPTIIKN